MFQFDVVTLFPEMFDAVTESGVTGRARERKLFELVLWNPRDFAVNSYRTVDDRPYGGGPGMVMLAEPLAQIPRAAIAGLTFVYRDPGDFGDDWAHLIRHGVQG